MLIFYQFVDGLDLLYMLDVGSFSPPMLGFGVVVHQLSLLASTTKC